LLGSSGHWQDTAEQPVPKEHPGGLDSLLPLHVNQEHSKGLDKTWVDPQGEGGGGGGREVLPSLCLPPPVPKQEKQLPEASQAPAEEVITMVVSHTVG
jgi:hypothetical protein